MESENVHVTGTGSSLVPPPSHPPTALAVTTAPTASRPRSLYERLQADPRVRRFVDDAVELVFDRADAVGDGIAKILGLRPKPPAAPTRSDAVD